MIDGVFTAGEEGQVHFAEAGALTPQNSGAVQRQVRARVLRWLVPLRRSPPICHRAANGSFYEDVCQAPL